MSILEGKPRFPLSVEREFTYRAYLEDTGEILESDSFRSVYCHLRHHLRGEVFHNLKENEYRHMQGYIQYGYETRYMIRKGYWYSEWTCVQDYGCLQISTLSEWFYSTADESNHCIKGDPIM